MTKSRLLILACVVVAIVASVAVSAAPQDDSVRIASLVNDMKSMDFRQLESLQPIKIEPYTLPDPGVDVMRVRIDETYKIDGVGQDTVELTGWIAVRRGAARPAPGETLVSWATAITDTEFVGLELQGESDVFGPVRVTLDGTRPAYGQVGKLDIDIPEKASQMLVATNTGGEGTDEAEADVSTCRAPVNVNVAMTDLGIEMTTKSPAVWYSRVTTIPPVGQVASVTSEPVSLVSSNREVGKLVSGKIKFREVVRSVPLSRNHEINRVAP